MPPYMRDSPASVTMAFKWSRCSGKNVLSTSAPDAERQLWPEGYAGWLGFPTAATTVISGSACHGRRNQYVSFASQQPICASNIVALSRARSEEHTSELQSRVDLVCRLLLEKKKNQNT